MKPLNKANQLLHDFLVHDQCVFDIGLDDYFIEGWLYQSCFPLILPIQDESNSHDFCIQLFQFCSKSMSLKIHLLKYELKQMAQIEYVPQEGIDSSINQMAVEIVQSDEFVKEIKPLLIQGFRELKIKTLIDTK